MSNQRYSRVNDIDDNSTPISPPPSFRSRTSSPIRHRNNSVDATLADTFDADGSDSEADNDGDDRSRLMRGGPSLATTTMNGQDDIQRTGYVVGTDGTRRPPQTVERTNTVLPSSVLATAGRVYGAGNQSDGVFANLSAKPEVGEKIEEHPPTYEQAAADSAPPYWETTILAPGLGGSDEVYVEGLPVGSVFSFVWNGMISMSFQLVGFLLTYLLHTTHAAKNGSRAGLGITMIQYGFYMKSSDSSDIPDVNAPAPSSPDTHDFNPDAVNAAPDGSGGATFGTSEWIAYALMIIGWFILIRAVSDFLRARRHEQLVLQSPDRGLGIPIIAEGEHDQTVV